MVSVKTLSYPGRHARLRTMRSFRMKSLARKRTGESWSMRLNEATESWKGKERFREREAEELGYVTVQSRAVPARDH